MAMPGDLQPLVQAGLAEGASAPGTRITQLLLQCKKASGAWHILDSCKAHRPVAIFAASNAKHSRGHVIRHVVAPTAALALALPSCCTVQKVLRSVNCCRL